MKTKLVLGESVKDKVRSSVWNLVGHSLMSSVRGSVNISVYDSVWRLLVDPVNNSTNFRL
jgi:hypothetical protein